MRYIDQVHSHVRRTERWAREDAALGGNLARISRESAEGYRARAHEWRTRERRRAMDDAMQRVAELGPALRESAAPEEQEVGR